MKIRHLTGVVVFLLILAASCLCNAETLYDISRYMPWQAGQWTMMSGLRSPGYQLPGLLPAKRRAERVCRFQERHLHDPFSL